jgi:hypothetical protein
MFLRRASWAVALAAFAPSAVVAASAPPPVENKVNKKYDEFILFSGSANPKLAEDIAGILGVKLGKIDVSRLILIEIILF